MQVPFRLHRECGAATMTPRAGEADMTGHLSGTESAADAPDRRARTAGLV